MPLVLLIAALFVVGVTAAVALGWVRGGLADPRPSRPDHELPPGRLTSGDVAGVRFSVAARGYRMDEVDEFVDRVLAELRAHQVDIGELRAEFGRPLLGSPAFGALDSSAARSTVDERSADEPAPDERTAVERLGERAVGES